MTRRELAEALFDGLQEVGSYEECGLYPYCWICNKKFNTCNGPCKETCSEGIEGWISEQSKGGTQ